MNADRFSLNAGETVRKKNKSALDCRSTITMKYIYVRLAKVSETVVVLGTQIVISHSITPIIAFFMPV